MTRRVKTHIRLGISSVSPSDQSPRCPHEETLGPYFFFLREIISRQGSSAAQLEKGAFFLG